jgi:signal transduction histidine kinase
MDGFETCKHLKSNPRIQDIPVIFMTALSDTADKVKGLRLGAVDYITKPFQHEEVLVRIEHQIRLRNLTKTLIAKNTELQQAQTQLFQAEKAAMLGNLTAGVAHEVNNPINFIAGNLNYVEQYVQEIVDLLMLYQKHLPDPPDEIQQAIQTKDLSFLLNDLSKIIQSMQVGTNRVTEIVSSLNNFTRHREAGKKLVNLHEGLDSTLLILGHRLRANAHRSAIQLIKDYGELPLIQCYPGEINQVFMNLLCNAIDAFDEAAQASLDAQRANLPTITIQTRLIEQNAVEIRICDNGKGMADEVKARVFDYLFTTKGMGKGTGLGLAIAHQIVVENHAGSLEVQSTLGQGTEFRIRLPVCAE